MVQSGATVYSCYDLDYSLQISPNALAIEGGKRKALILDP